MKHLTPIWTPQDFTETVRALWKAGVRFPTDQPTPAEVETAWQEQLAACNHPALQGRQITLAPVIDLKTRKQIG